MEVTSITKWQNFVFKSKKLRKCLFLRLQGNYSTRVCPEGQTVTGIFYLCSGTPVEEDSPCPARVLSTRQLVSSSRHCTGQLLYENFYPENKWACSTILPASLIYPPVIIFCSPNWSYHWKDACLKMLKTSKQLWHRVFGPYHKTTCRGPSNLYCHSLYRCRRDVLWIKYR